MPREDGAVAGLCRRTSSGVTPGATIGIGILKGSKSCAPHAAGQHSRRAGEHMRVSEEASSSRLKWVGHRGKGGGTACAGSCSGESLGCVRPATESSQRSATLRQFRLR